MKTRGGRGLNVVVTQMTDNPETTATECEDQISKTESLEKFTLSNGLVIEKLANGPPGGKIAVPGKMVCLFFLKSEIVNWLADFIF